MKFIDEFDLEVVNQALNFETSDCSITGGCDVFTTKPVASDKKLYKTIDRHLESLIQESESLTAAAHRRQSVDEKNGVIEEKINEELHSPNPNSFWEQKRRMSVSENPNGATVSPVIKSNKLNDQNLKEFVLSTDSMASPVVTSGTQSNSNNSHSNNNNNNNNLNNSNGYMSSSSVDSGSLGIGPHNSAFLRRSSSAGSIASNHTDSSKRRPSTSGSIHEASNSPLQRRRSSVQTRENVNIGPFGPINETASRRAFAYLIAILNASYPDHDFSSLEPTDFVKCSKKSFISKFENTLISLGKPPQEWIWETINSHMDINECAFYQYVPQKSFLEDEPGHLWSLMWFLFNKKRKRVAYVYLTAFRLKGTSSVGNSIILGEDEDDSSSKVGAERRRARKLTLDNDNDFEGEYDLTYEENAVIDDDDEDMDPNFNNNGVNNRN